MTLLFFQNIVSPHQVTYIRECVKDSRVEKVLLVVPRTDIEERQKMGWEQGRYYSVGNSSEMCREMQKIIDKENTRIAVNPDDYSWQKRGEELDEWLSQTFNF